MLFFENEQLIVVFFEFLPFMEYGKIRDLDLINLVF